MRRSNGSKFLFDGEILVGVSLGADFTSEHEWGIQAIKHLLGIPFGDKDWGIARRKMTRCPDTLTFGWAHGNTKNSEGLYLLESWGNEKPTFSKNNELTTWGDKTLACAWDQGSFGVFSADPKEIGYLHEIYDAFLANDGCTFLGGGRAAFCNAGLVLCIASRLPAEIIDNWYKSDKDYYDLDQEVKATGIEDLLKKGNKGYYALSPTRKDDGSIVFWLNPREQKENNYGWYTLDDLKEWADGKGKIPISKEATK